MTGPQPLLLAAGFSFASERFLPIGLGPNTNGFVIPMALNTISADEQQTSRSRHPLLSRIARVDGSGTTWTMGVDDSVKLFVTNRRNSTVLPHMKRETSRPSDKWLYLFVRCNDPSASASSDLQIELANRIVNAFEHALYSPSIDCAPGTQCGHRDMTLVFDDLPCALWSAIRDHDDNTRFLTCPNCGRSLLVPNDGHRRIFCSDSCRVSSHQKRLREASQ
jgi:hypothetical protein